MSCNGWPSGGSSPDALNASIPFLSIFLPASVWTPAKLQPAIWTPALQLGDPGASLNDTVDTWVFPTGVNTEIYTKINFMGIPIDIADPQLRYFPEYMQIDDLLKPDPAEFAFMEYAIGTITDLESEDYSLEGTEEVQDQSEIQAQWVAFAGGTTGDKSILFDGFDNGGALSGTLKNNLRIQLERFGTNVSDTYGEDVHFMGMNIQYKTDFNNIKVFPT